MAKAALPPGLDRRMLLSLFEEMVTLRRFELAAQEKCKTGEIKFVHLYVGEEATAVGVCAHLSPKDWITSTHRGHGHALAKGLDPRVLMAELYGKATGCCAGRGGSMHLYAPAIGLFGTNGIVCGGNPSAVGAAIGATVRKSGQVSVAFFGDGGSNNGSFHESMNFAGIQRAPVVFVCENNLYATATPLTAATLNTDISSKAAAHGIPGVAVDGNDVVAVWQASKQAVDRARAGQGPTLIEARTYRTVGHHEGDPVVGVYRTQAEIDEWKKRDPILTFRRRLIEDFQVATAEDLDAIEAKIQEVMVKAVEFAQSSQKPDPSTAYRYTWNDPINPPIPAAEKPVRTATQGWLDAVRDGIAEEMRRDPHMIYFGEGIGERGGSFAHTKGLWKEFGGGRVIDTPISELAFTGAALGASATGSRAVADLMFIEFLFEAASQVILQASKLRYMSNNQMSAPVVMRAASGAVRGAGPHHSGSYHPLWAHVPGLIVVMPSNPADAKGLMKTALRAYDPVIFLEPKILFGSKGEVPTGEHLVPFGQAKIVREGKNLTIVAFGQMVQVAVAAAAALEKEGISCEVLDPRTVVPLDVEAIAASLAKTGHLLIVDEGYSMCGIGAEIAQSMMELAFDDLDAPIGRLHTDPVSHPVSDIMEEAVAVTLDKVIAGAKQVMAGHSPRAIRAKGLSAVAGPGAESADTPAGKAPADAGRKASAEAASPSAPTVTSPSAPTVTSTPAPAALAAPAPPTPVKGEALTMPHGDLTVTEATVVKWYKKVGDPVAKGETVVDVETDKAVTYIESPIDGVLVQILEPEGKVVKMGQQLAVIGPK